MEGAEPAVGVFTQPYAEAELGARRRGAHLRHLLALGVQRLHLRCIDTRAAKSDQHRSDHLDVKYAIEKRAWTAVGRSNTYVESRRRHRRSALRRRGEQRGGGRKAPMILQAAPWERLLRRERISRLDE